MLQINVVFTNGQTTTYKVDAKYLGNAINDLTRDEKVETFDIVKA